MCNIGPENTHPPDAEALSLLVSCLLEDPVAGSAGEAGWRLCPTALGPDYTRHDVTILEQWLIL